MQARSLYVHFPFCETKCHYCDFYSIARARAVSGDTARFEGALTAETRLATHGSLPGLDPTLDTIFLGGGTPSLTDPDSMARALAPVLERAQLSGNLEFTMEANPSSIETQRMRDYRSLGVNRVSMGVQSLRDDHLKWMGRAHDRAQAFEALDAVFMAGFENVSVDLLCGVPGQTLEDIDQAIKTLTSYPITHLSCYLLTLAPHHPQHSLLPNEETQLEHLLFVHERMERLGFEHYEISNYARPNRRARHNLKYWQGESYLGLGPSAHSFDAKTSRRWKNHSSLHKYCAQLESGALPVEWTETLTPEQSGLERWMLALRLSEGFPLEWVKDSPAKIAKIDALAHHALLEPHPTTPGRLRLTARGFALSDQVIRELATAG